MTTEATNASLAKMPVPSAEAVGNLTLSEQRDKRDVIVPSGQLWVQPKLTMGAPDDPYEKEADAVADKVMRMPEQHFIDTKSAGSGSLNLHRNINEEEKPLQMNSAVGGNFIQKKCAACDKEEEKIQRKPLFEGITPFLQRKSTDSAIASNGLEHSIGSTKGSGSSLDPYTQSFMSHRFGNDFSGVKIHTDSRAVQLNRELNAKAFTVGSDVYFNEGQYQPYSDSGKRLLAHELTHVVQQGKSPIQRQPFIQRAYWVGVDPTGKEKTGTRIHHEVLHDVGVMNSDLFTEAPVPNADSKSVAYGNRGSADFYKASTTVGIQFPNHFQPDFLNAPSKLRLGGKKFQHVKNSAPKFDGKINVNNAPVSIRVGDLKPYGAEDLDPKYEEQIGNYVNGYETVKNEINQMAADPAQKDKIKPSGGKWSVNVDKLKGAGSLLIPDKYKVGSSAAPSQRIILKEGQRKKYFIRQRITGKMFLAYRKDQEGVWNYFWIPDTPITVATLPPGVAAFQLNMNAIINPLIDLRIQPKREKSNTSHKDVKVHANNFLTDNPTIRRKKGTANSDKKDNFSYTDWEASWKKFNTQFNSTSKKELEDAEGLVAGRDTQKDIGGKFTGVSTPGAESAKEKENIKLVKQIKFWSHPLAHYVGKLRQFFGRAFAKAYSVIESIKAKVQGLLKKGRSAISKSGLAGAVVKLFIKIFKMVGKYMVDKTIDLVLNSILEGAKAKINTFVDSIVPDEVDVYIEKIKGIQAEFEQISLEKIESLFEPYLENFKTFKEIEEKASGVMAIVNLVRWGARVIACLSPPAIGCLWAIASSVIEEIAARVVDSCWFIKKVGSRVAEKLMDFEMVKTIPVSGAQFIIKTINGIMPEGWKDTFPEPPASHLTAIKSSYDGSCPEEGGGEPFDQTRREIIELIEEIGEEKFLALLELSLKRGAGPWVLLNKERLELLKMTLEGITVEQLKDAAKDTSMGSLGTLDKFLTHIKEYTPKEKVLIEQSAEEKRKKAELQKGGGKGEGEAGGKEKNEGKGKGSGLSYEIIKGKMAFDQQKATPVSMTIGELTIKSKQEEVKPDSIYDAGLTLYANGAVIHIPDLKIRVENIMNILTTDEQPPATYYITMPENIYIKLSTGETYKLNSLNISQSLIKFSTW